KEKFSVSSKIPKIRYVRLRPSLPFSLTFSSIYVYTQQRHRQPPLQLCFMLPSLMNIQIYIDTHTRLVFLICISIVKFVSAPFIRFLPAFIWPLKLILLFLHCRSSFITIAHVFDQNFSDFFITSG